MVAARCQSTSVVRDQLAQGSIICTHVAFTVPSSPLVMGRRGANPQEQPVPAMPQTPIWIPQPPPPSTMPLTSAIGDSALASGASGVSALAPALNRMIRSPSTQSRETHAAQSFPPRAAGLFGAARAPGDAAAKVNEAEPRATINWKRFLWHYLKIRQRQRLFAHCGLALQDESAAARKRVQDVYPKE